MSGPRKKTGRPASDGVDLRLDNLLGELGSALTKMIDRLDDGDGEIRRDHEFQTERGPVQAHAGVRIRMGGVEAARGSGDAAQPTGPRGPAPPPGPILRSIEAHIFDDGRVWRLTADLPGIAQDDLELVIEGRDLVLSARSHARSFAGRFELPHEIRLDNLQTSLRNGILEIEAPSAGGGAE